MWRGGGEEGEWAESGERASVWLEQQRGCVAAVEACGDDGQQPSKQTARTRRPGCCRPARGASAAYSPWPARPPPLPGVRRPARRHRRWQRGDRRLREPSGRPLGRRPKRAGTRAERSGPPACRQARARTRRARERQGRGWLAGWRRARARAGAGGGSVRRERVWKKTWPSAVCCWAGGESSRASPEALVSKDHSLGDCRPCRPPN